MAGHLYGVRRALFNSCPVLCEQLRTSNATVAMLCSSAARKHLWRWMAWRSALALTGIFHAMRHPFPVFSCFLIAVAVADCQSDRLRAYAEFSLIQINFVQTKLVPGRTEISLSDNTWTNGRMQATLYSRLLRIQRCCRCRISAANNIAKTWIVAHHDFPMPLQR